MNKQNEKIVCGCGGSYTNRNKAVHMKTKRHQSYENVPVPVPVPVVIPVVNQAPSVEDVYKTIRSMSEDDQKKLMDMLLADTPAPVIPKEEPAEPSVFDKFRKRITEYVGEDIFVNSHRPDVDDDEDEHQDEIEQKAFAIMSKEEDEMWDDATKVCELKQCDNRIKYYGDDDDAELIETTKPYVLREFEKRGLETKEEQYKWLAKYTPKFAKGPCTWGENDLWQHFNRMKNMKASVVNRHKHKEKLQKEVDKILQRRPYLRVLL